MNPITISVIQSAIDADNSINADEKGSLLNKLNMPDKPLKLISEHKAAEMLGIDYTTLYNWRNYGKGGKNRKAFSFNVYPKIIGDGVHYNEYEIREHLQSIIRNPFKKEKS